MNDLPFHRHSVVLKIRGRKEEKEGNGGGEGREGEDRGRKVMNGKKYPFHLAKPCT